ncbi:unnamed protein product [Dovyalis caffra]|uniref:Uncharacterized protein n=1 Tax=Dovyalis caffra TaxID=77055 RepID=A0AAV1QTD1_9ROSI|nr:unnamed protein product [Dovyalis caffra]
MSVGDKKIVEKRFVFNGEAISNLKADVKTNGCGSKLPEHQPTRVEVVTALIWRGLIMFSQARHGYLRPSLLTHAVNLRGRTILHIPEKSCGNFTGIGIAQFIPKPDDESNMQFHVHKGMLQRIEYLNIFSKLQEFLIHLKTNSEAIYALPSAA